MNTTLRENLGLWRMVPCFLVIGVVVLLSAQPVRAQVPPPPGNLTATTVSDAEIRLSWQDRTNDELGFEITLRQQLAGALQWVFRAGANVTTYLMTGLEPGSSYVFAVRSFHEGGRYSASSSVGGITHGLRVPSHLTATPLSSSQVRLSWQNNTRTRLAITIYRGPGDGFSSTPIATVPAGTTTYADIGLRHNTTYQYLVTLLRGLESANFSPPTTVTTPGPPPAAPTDLHARPALTTQIDLSWRSNATDATGFKIERKTGAAGAWSQVGTVPSNTTTYSSAGLSPATSYVYRVRAYNVGGDSPYSNEASAAPARRNPWERETPPTSLGPGKETVATLPAPAAPSHLTASAVSAAQIDLRWQDNAGNERGFTIERKTGATGSWSPIASLGANVTVHRDTGVGGNVLYYYRVRAGNQAGVSPYSNEASAGWIPPAGPSNLTATPASPRHVRLTWLHNSNDEMGLKIERRTEPTGNWSQIAQVSSCNGCYYDDGLQSLLSPATTYAYRVRAYNAAGHSPYSSEARASTPATGPPAAPSNLNVSLVSPRRIDLRWQDMSGDETGFQIERMTAAMNWTVIATPGTGVTTYSDAGVNPSATYSYRVRAFNSAGHSPYSNVATMFTMVPPPAPITLRATAISSRGIRLDWSYRSDVQAWFEIERKTGASGSWRTINRIQTAVTKYEDTGLAATTAYYYRVRTVHPQGGASGYSNEATATTPR